MDGMASVTTTDVSMLQQAPVAVSGTRATRRRRITPKAGHALLGHAIEYLTDEHLHQGGTFAAHDGQWQAIQLLMGLNRQVYFECPEVLTLTDRFLGFLNWGGAQVRSADGSRGSRSSRAA